MAAVTPATILRESSGSLTMNVCSFTGVNNGDTYATGVPVITATTNRTDAATSQGKEGIDANYTAGGTTVTFKTAESGTVSFDLIMYTRS
jgi:hypothetical protein